MDAAAAPRRTVDQLTALCAICTMILFMYIMVEVYMVLVEVRKLTDMVRERLPAVFDRTTAAMQQVHSTCKKE